MSVGSPLCNLAGKLLCHPTSGKILWKINKSQPTLNRYRIVSSSLQSFTRSGGGNGGGGDYYSWFTYTINYPSNELIVYSTAPYYAPSQIMVHYVDSPMEVDLRLGSDGVSQVSATPLITIPQWGNTYADCQYGGALASATWTHPNLPPSVLSGPDWSISLLWEKL